MTVVLVAIAALCACLWIGLRLRKRLAIRRRLSLLLLVAGVAIAVAGLLVSFSYAGLPSRFPAGTHGALMRTWVVAPLALTTLALPGLLAFAVTQWLSVKLSATQAGVLAVAVAALSVPFCFFLLLIPGCNLAGACI